MDTRLIQLNQPGLTRHHFQPSPADRIFSFTPFSAVGRQTRACPAADGKALFVGRLLGQGENCNRPLETTGFGRAKIGTYEPELETNYHEPAHADGWRRGGRAAPFFGRRRSVR